jgi:hypothetical protein
VNSFCVFMTSGCHVARPQPSRPSGPPTGRLRLRSTYRIPGGAPSRRPTKAPSDAGRYALVAGACQTKLFVLRHDRSQMRDFKFRLDLAETFLSLLLLTDFFGFSWPRSCQLPPFAGKAAFLTVVLQRPCQCRLDISSHFPVGGPTIAVVNLLESVLEVVLVQGRRLSPFPPLDSRPAGGLVYVTLGLFGRVDGPPLGVVVVVRCS